MKVSDVMTRHPESIGLEAPLREAAELMRRKGIRHLPVIGDRGRLVGILTDRDLKHAAFIPALAEHLGWARHRVAAPRVRDVMTWSIVTTRPDATLVEAALTMFSRRIGSLPVVEDGELTGILTESDVVRGFRGAQHIETDAFLW